MKILAAALVVALLGLGALTGAYFAQRDDILALEFQVATLSRRVESLEKAEKKDKAALRKQDAHIKSVASVLVSLIRALEEQEPAQKDPSSWMNPNNGVASRYSTAPTVEPN